MLCPNCDTQLKMSERQGVEIDYCPQCRGVWLDRGELDKIIERSASQIQAPLHRDHDHKQKRYPKHFDNDYKQKNDYKYKKRKKRESFLEDLFDIF